MISIPIKLKLGDLLMTKYHKQTIRDVSISLIDEPKDVLRLDIDPQKINDLAQSISEIGLLQPILVAVDGDRFELVFGHRRFLACKQLELSKIRSIVREMTAEEIGLARATENINRADLTPIEEANTYNNLITVYGLAIEGVALKMGKTAATIKRRLDLLKMPPQLQEAVHNKRISMTVAEELWPISDLTDLDYYLSFALDGGCTKDVARSWCKDWRDKKRRQQSAGVEGVREFAPAEPRPIYVSCDLCRGPMEIGQELVLRICKDCGNIVTKNMKEVLKCK
jgi:ParB/RepB/Spo0J family partition protein